MLTLNSHAPSDESTFFKNSFLYFIFKVPINRIFLTLAVVISVFSWLLFKYFYPNANTIFDSYYYLLATVNNADVNAWPIGYSKILRLVGFFSHSVNILLAIQYFFLQICLMYFFFGLLYFFRPRRFVAIVIFLFLILNPIYLYTANLVLSDAIFLGISLLWFILLIQIIYHPHWGLIIAQSVLLLLAFSIRYSAMYYPAISCFVLIISHKQFLKTALGVFISIGFIVGFILYTSNKNQDFFGVHQFSPFGGWKVASNALYAYEHVPASKLSPVPESFKELDSMVRSYYASRHSMVTIDNPDPSWGSYYMFIYPSPLIVYRNKHFGIDTVFHVMNLETLAKLGPLYNSYGSYVINKYPVEFLKYFVWPNIKNYFTPYPEVYSDSKNPFTLSSDTLGGLVKRWFGISNTSAGKAEVEFRTAVFIRYPLLNTYCHLTFFMGIIFLFWLKSWQSIPVILSKIFWFITIFWGINFFFMITASASLLRYQLFICIVEFCVGLIWLDQAFVAESKSNLEDTD